MKKTLALAVSLLAVGSVSAGQGDSAKLGAANAPQIRASENTDINFDGNEPAVVLGALDADDSTYNRTFNDCDTLSALGDSVSYDTITITNQSGNDASMEVFSSSQGDPAACGGIDTYMAAYIPSFNPADGTENCVAFNDDGPVGTCSSITLDIPQGQTAVVVTTSYENGEFFDYQVNFTCIDCTVGGGGGGVVLPPPRMVPTLQNSALIGLGLLMLGVGAMSLRRRED